MGQIKIEINGFRCERCGHEWIPRKEKSIICPKCKSAYWDRPKSNNLGGNDGNRIVKDEGERF